MACCSAVASADLLSRRHIFLADLTVFTGAFLFSGFADGAIELMLVAPPRDWARP